MLANLKDLDRVHYGTTIHTKAGDIRVQLTHGSEHPLCQVPSDRELLRKGITREQWNNNEVVTVPDFYGEIYPRKARDVIRACDHFEDQLSYSVSKQIVDLINRGEIKV